MCKEGKISWEYLQEAADIKNILKQPSNDISLLYECTGTMKREILFSSKLAKTLYYM